MIFKSGNDEPFVAHGKLKVGEYALMWITTFAQPYFGGYEPAEGEDTPIYDALIDAYLHCVHSIFNMHRLDTLEEKDILAFLKGLRA